MQILFVICKSKLYESQFMLQPNALKVATTYESPSWSLYKSNFLVAIAIAKFYKSTIYESYFTIAIAFAIFRAIEDTIAVAIDVVIAVAIAATYYACLNFPSQPFYKSKFLVDVAITEFYKSNFIIAVAAAFAIAFVIPLQSKTVLSSLIHFDDSIPQVLVSTNELQNDLRKPRSTTGFAFTYCEGAIVYISKT